MLNRVADLLQRCLLATVVAGVLTSGAMPSIARAQSASPVVEAPAGPSAATLLAKGRELESQKRWGDALAFYEDALREHPSDASLRQRFVTARMHFSLERRYTDDSFVDSVHELSSQQAEGLYRELLSKMETHYVTTPQWDAAARKGIYGLRIALQEPQFLRANGVRASSKQVSQLDEELRQLGSGALTNSSQGALAAQQQAARLASYRIGLNPVATSLEFTAAAAETLDHYSSFLTPAQLRDVYSQIEGNFVGLGVELKPDNGALLIVRVIPNSPAERGGIHDGDRIVAVDGQATAELSTDEAAGLLTGEEGSYCRVTVVSPREEAHVVARPTEGRLSSWMGEPTVTRDLSVRREHVDVPSLEDVRILDPQYGVAYVRVPVFQKSTSRDLDAALWDLHGKGMRSLILDLRGNPGGLLTSSVEMADKFVAEGRIVSTSGRSEGETIDFRAHRAGTWRVPLVVLIDGDSASASEIFAAAIKDSNRGAIVGERSFGKGSVQGIFSLGQGGAGIRLTTAKFFSPLGHPISKVGVNPDIVVRRATSLTEGRSENSDAALTRAVEAAKIQVAMR
ncbi:putative CtpA-like serine protease [Posidoniimonas polymericola]|uniref:Putative CtpA-like serine protease n=1 Tax=Posidoniimonas polymericola TaxID=2528002 RepID=A0A5C5XWC6_9BACT|nr:S41 family peptidase [Posidoniimonas polymericola]TWT65932.1 putative CtpA-like serine protease [Posidoniimonas polymericola]